MKNRNPSNWQRFVMLRRYWEQNNNMQKLWPGDTNIRRFKREALVGMTKNIIEFDRDEVKQ